VIALPPGLLLTCSTRRSLSRRATGVEPVLTDVVDEDVVTVEIEHDRLTPQVGLIDRIAREGEALPLESFDRLVDVIDLEMDARS